jgi:hypothetical protein
MKRFHIIGRVAAILAGLTGIVVLLGAGTASAALAGGDPHEPPGLYKPRLLRAHTHAAVAGGLPWWQIALILAGVALLTGALALLVHRVRAARQRVTVSTA